MTSTTSGPSLGPLIHMRALALSELPAHPDLASQQASAPDFDTFVTAVLAEAETFMTAYLPQKFQVKDTQKTSAPARAHVKLFSHEVDTQSLPKEARDAGAGSESWFARESIHENKAEEGTASWAEFDNGLRVDHSQHEKDYTPDVIDAHEALNWDAALQEKDRRVGGWEDVHMSIMEMRHHIPAPLNNRVFSVLVVTAKRGDGEFLVVQIPVATKGIPGAKYVDAPKLTGGIYCSVERGELIEQGQKVRWQMATASDARGSLPMFVQKIAIPGAVVKDVGLFVGWAAEQRKV